MKNTRSSYRPVLYINLLLTCAVFVLNYFYQYHNFNYTLKCCTSTCFALIGVVNLFWAWRAKQRRMGVYGLLALGLVLALLGDVAINPSFVIGAALFALGHVFLVTAYCALQPVRKTDVLFTAVLVTGSVAFLLLYPHFTFAHPVFHVVCVVYAVIISVMLGKAAGNFLHCPNLFYGLLALGSLLFFFSDLMLLLHWFVGRWSWTDHACMATYYPALCLIGLSMYVHIAQPEQ